MNTELPLWTNWIAAILLILVFTGTWVLLNDLKRVLEVSADGNARIVRFVLGKLRVRRVLSLLAGIGVIGAYFAGVPMTVIGAGLFALFWLAALSLMSRARNLVNQIDGKP